MTNVTVCTKQSASTWTGPAGRRARVVLAAVVATLTVLASACGSSSGTAGSGAPGAQSGADAQPVDGGSLVIGIGAETNGWNPAQAQWADTGSLVGSTVLEPLATTDENNGAQPWLAESWIANDAFTEWAIKLRPGVTFHDGTPMDADAVRRSLLSYVDGPLSGLAIKPMFRGITVVDPLTIQVSLTQPWAAFPNSFLQGGSSYIMAPAMLDAPDKGAAHPIGTGPFVFDSWTPDSTFKARKNPNYWQKGLPHLDSIEFRVIPDDTARVDALKTGDVNVIYTTRAQDANDLQDSFAVSKDWDTESAFIMTNTAPEPGGKPNPLANVHARRALAYATDRDAVASAIGEGVQVPTSPWSPTNPWGMPSDQNGYVDHDLEKAKQEVEAYKADTGATSLSFELAGLPNLDDQKVLQLLDSQWQAAGIEVSIDSLEQTAYITKIAVGDYQAAFFRNYGYADPDGDFYFWSSTTAKGSGNISINFTQYTTPQIDQDLTTGRQNGYPNIRKQAYDDLVHQLNASATNIWLYNTPYSFIADPKVHGLPQTGGVRFGNYMAKTWLGGLWREP
jgi:peptide/nickel transport system substrate-binding protein